MVELSWHTLEARTLGRKLWHTFADAVVTVAKLLSARIPALFIPAESLIVQVAPFADAIIVRIELVGVRINRTVVPTIWNLVAILILYHDRLNNHAPPVERSRSGNFQAKTAQRAEKRENDERERRYRDYCPCHFSIHYVFTSLFHPPKADWSMNYSLVAPCGLGNLFSGAGGN
ncbi:MAG: hypothetical protein WC445_02030 [Patescibacteria group bacterium]